KAHFGYNNPNAAAVHIDKGEGANSRNVFLSGTQPLVDPIVDFAVGNHEDALTVEFDPSWSLVTWAVRTPNLAEFTATADRSTQWCDGQAYSGEWPTFLSKKCIDAVKSWGGEKTTSDLFDYIAGKYMPGRKPKMGWSLTRTMAAANDELNLLKLRALRARL